MRFKANRGRVQSLVPCIQCLRNLNYYNTEIMNLLHISVCGFYRILNPDYATNCRAAAKNWSDKNKDKVAEIGRNWVAKNPEKQRQRTTEWRKKNPHKAAIYERKQLLKPQRRLAQNMRRRLRGLLAGNAKQSATKLVGCSWQEFMAHIESKMTEGMTWANYGVRGWHLDHIFPASKADLSIPEEAQRIFHYTNIQPMWGEENIRKHNKLNYVKA